MKNLSLVLVLAVSLTACKTNKKYNADVAAANAAGYSSGQADAQANAVKAANFMVSLQASSPSSTYSVVKFAQDNADVVVISFGSGPVMYAAVDISDYTTGTNANTYAMTHPVYINLTNNGNGTFSCNAGTCMNASGPTSSTMVFEKTTTASKDMDKAAAFVESYRVETMAAGLASEFGLSEERSLKVAKLAASWDKLAKTRALTNADADMFAQELAGVNFAEINSAEQSVMNGSMTELNSIITKAAVVNGTSSENMSAIMMKLFF